MYCELELLICVHFPMAATLINKEDACGLWLFQVSFQCFNVAVQYFEEIFLDIQKERAHKAY